MGASEVALCCAVESVQEALKQTEGVIYDRYIKEMAKPYSLEFIGIHLCELVLLGQVRYDKIASKMGDYEYESIEEPIRPKIDRWVSRNCPVQKVDKIEYSDFDIDELNMFQLDILAGVTHSHEKGNSFIDASTISKKSGKNSLKSKSTMKFKHKKLFKRVESKEEKVNGGDLDLKNEPAHPQFPLEDLAPPEVSIEEKRLRDRKDKQEVNQLKKEQELAERKKREQELKKALQRSEHTTDFKNKKITYDHHGKVLMIKKVPENRLVKKVEPGIIIDPENQSDKKHKKTKKKRPRPIDSSLFLKRTHNSETTFMGTLQDCAPDPSDAIQLEPGVSIETNGRFISGPEFEKTNRMTLNDYYILCQNNNADKVRYEKTGNDSQSKIPGDKGEDFISQASDSIFNPKEGNLLDVQKLRASSTSKKRPKTGRKLITKITGNLAKAKILQEEVVEKRVNFNASKKNSTIFTNRPGSSKKSFYSPKSIHNSNLSRISKHHPALKSRNMRMGVRPQTARNYYTDNIKKITENKNHMRVKNLFQKRKHEKPIKEAVIKYNEMENQENSDAHNFLSGSRAHSRMRPGTAVHKGPIIPEHVVSAFDQFNRDILDHKVPNESVKRINLKSTFMKTSRVHSARRNPNGTIPKPRIRPVSSAKSLKTVTNSPSKFKRTPKK
ncbi:unnamed protein product [Moneuplotes crassus]|uniref:Uncharacterized protein n=1 Tax=Euplotes crassus TaxID=5936 RepID=A0AAD1X5J2_EUPCR|nr:unnamed protein product [Moneuplotes crassus]